MALISGGVGFLTGAAAYGWVAAKSLGVWNRVVQTQFAIEQEQRSARAERQGDLLAALHHRWNVVEARSDAWLHSFETWEPPAPWFALGFLMLRKIAEGADPEGKGHRVVEGIARGQLARVLGTAWAGAEGRVLSLWVSEGGERFTKVLSDYWYQAPRCEQPGTWVTP